MIKAFIEEEEVAVVSLTLDPNMEYTLIGEVPLKYWSGSLTLKFNLRFFDARQSLGYR